MAEVHVVAIQAGGQFWSDLEQSKDVQMTALFPARARNKVGRAFQYACLVPKLRRILRQEKPDRIYSMLYSNNILAYLGTPALLRERLVWGVRTVEMTSGSVDRWCRALGKKLSRSVNRVVANSYAGKEFLRSFGYQSARIEVVHNGIDTDFFRIQSHARETFRNRHGISSSEFVVGMVGRMDPIKGHADFIQACEKAFQDSRPVKVLFAGVDKSEYAKKLFVEAAKRLGEDRLLWLPIADGLLELYNGLDCLVSCSRCEGFSNVIGEAMACGTPAIVTDVGDSSRIVDDVKLTVKPGQIDALTLAITTVRDGWERDELRVERYREKIQRHFSVEKAIESTWKALDLEGR